MEVLYKNILEYKDAALLLQGYDFAGFSEWYRLNSQILNKKVMSKNLSLVNEEFDRDLNFLDVLVSSLEYLQINLKKTLSLWVN
jgi:hypothetical protein